MPRRRHVHVLSASEHGCNAMTSADQELVFLRRERRNLQKRHRREQAKLAESLRDVAIERDVLMVYILAGHDSRVAVEYIRRKCKRKQREIHNEDLVADVENAYLGIDVHAITSMFDDESREQRCLHRDALKHVVESALYDYVVRQNCANGVAPSREQLVVEVLRILNNLPPDSPTVATILVIGSLVSSQ